jgi:hypothetical protein
VVHDESKANAGALPGPFEHLQVAVGVAERGNRVTSDVHLNPPSCQVFTPVNEQTSKCDCFSSLEVVA